MYVSISQPKKEDKSQQAVENVFQNNSQRTRYISSEQMQNNKRWRQKRK